MDEFVEVIYNCETGEEKTQPLDADALAEIEERRTAHEATVEAAAAAEQQRRDAVATIQATASPELADAILRLVGSAA